MEQVDGVTITKEVLDGKTRVVVEVDHAKVVASVLPRLLEAAKAAPTEPKKRKPRKPSAPEQLPLPLEQAPKTQQEAQALADEQAKKKAKAVVTKPGQTVAEAKREAAGAIKTGEPVTL